MAHCHTGAKLENTKAIITDEAVRAGFPPNVLLAVAEVESSFNPNAIGSSGETTVFQLMPDVRRGKHLNTRDAARVAIRELVRWSNRCPVKDSYTFVICYNSGHRRPKYPLLHPYYKKFMIAYKKAVSYEKN